MAKRAASPSKKADPAGGGGAASGGGAGGGAAGGAEAVPGVVVIAGPDLYRQHQALVRVRERLRARHGAVDLVLFDGASATAAEVLDECRSFGLIATHKLVVVDPADKMLQPIKDDEEGGEADESAGPIRPLFERYQASPTESATLVLRFKKLNNGRIEKAAEAEGGLFKCPEFEEQALPGFIAERASAHRVKLDRHASAALAERVGKDAARLDSEIAKLGAIAAGLEKDPTRAGDVAVTQELVGEFVGRSREESVWDLQRVVLHAGPAASVAYVRSLLEVSREPTVLVSFALVDLARKLHAMCLGMRAGIAPQALAGMLKLWGPSKDALMGVARVIEPRTAGRVLKAALEADQRQKTGLSEGGRALEVLALRMATIVAKLPKPEVAPGGGWGGGGWNGGQGGRGRGR